MRFCIDEKTLAETTLVFAAALLLLTLGVGFLPTSTSAMSLSGSQIAEIRGCCSTCAARCCIGIGWNSPTWSSSCARTMKKWFASTRPSIEFSWHGLREHRIGAVTVKKPRVRISDRLLGAARNETPAPRASQTETKTWHVKKFAVIEGVGEIDLANAPLIRFSFAPEFHDLHLSADPKSVDSAADRGSGGHRISEPWREAGTGWENQPHRVEVLSTRSRETELRRTHHPGAVVSDYTRCIEDFRSFRSRSSQPPHSRTRDSATVSRIFASANCWSKTARFSSRISAKRFRKAL